jgi:uncharacterized protein YdeI (YjbR/CyaY-like superfamily)
MQQKEPQIFYPQSRAAWRKWLEKNHLSQQSVWVVFYAKKSAKKSITWSEAVDEALCFGWIDSKKIKIDTETSHQFFSKRKEQSTWSRINKVKVEQLIESGQMRAAGYESIALAKKNGSWTILDDVEELIVPNDLEGALSASPGAKEYFMSLSKSSRKAILQWVTLAKRPETRHKRLVEIVERAEQKLKPKHIP